MRLAGEELQDGDDLGPSQDREAEGALHTDVQGGVRPREIGVLGDVHDPGRLSSGQDAPRQADPNRKARPAGDLLEAPEALRLIQVPDERRDQLAGAVLGQHEGVADRPAGVSADLVNSDLQGVATRGSLVGRHRHGVQQLDQRRLPVDRLFSLLPFPDIADERTEGRFTPNVYR